MSDFWKAEAIAKRYEFIEELGKGGIGTVVLARDKILDKLVAIKILNANLSSEESIRFQQEGILSGRLKHENIVSVLDFGVTDTNIPYLVMERLEGVSLAKVLADDGALDVSFAVQIFQQICRAMTSSHASGVVHRDLKPANIIMVPNDDGSFSAKIVDFGLARMIEQNQRLTSTGSAIGSPLYMSPEQGQGQAGDERSDIYSMGCLMFEILTRTTPFQGETAVQTLMMHQNQQPDQLSARSLERFPPMLEVIVAKTLKKLPEQRYQSFADLQNDLRALEEELARLEREEYLESSTRSGVQKALGAFTDVGAPLAAGLSKNKIAVKQFVIIAIGVSFTFAFALLLPQLQEIYEAQLPKEPGLAFKDSIETFEKLGISKKDGKTFVLGHQTTTDIDLKKLHKYNAIEELDLHGSLCEGTGFAYMKNSTIPILNICSTPLTDDGARLVAHLKGLKRLVMTDTDELTNSGFSLISRQKELESIFFGGELLTEESFNCLKSFPSLKEVGLDEFHLTRAGIEEVLQVPNLQTVRFLSCKFGDGVLVALEQSQKNFGTLSFAKVTLTAQMVDRLAKVKVRHIVLDEVKTAKSEYIRISKDPRYFWEILVVDGKPVADKMAR